MAFDFLFVEVGSSSSFFFFYYFFFFFDVLGRLANQLKDALPPLSGLECEKNETNSKNYNLKLKLFKAKKLNPKKNIADL